MTGYTLAVHQFKLNFLVFAMFIAGNFIPFQILMIPVRQLTINLGMYDTYWGLIIFHIAFQTGFCTFFLRNFIKELPFKLIESALPPVIMFFTVQKYFIHGLTFGAVKG